MLLKLLLEEAVKVSFTLTSHVHIKTFLPKLGSEQFIEMIPKFRLFVKSTNWLIHEGDHALALVVLKNPSNHIHSAAFDAKWINHYEGRRQLRLLFIYVVKQIAHMRIE